MKKWQRWGVFPFSIIGIAVIIIMINFITQPPPSSPHILPHIMIAQLTGKGAINDSAAYDVKGTDLGIPVKYQGQMRFLFGDTFGGDFTYWSNPNGNNDTHWRSNTMAYSTDTNASDGITIDGWVTNSSSGLARELIPSLKNDVEVTCIPTTAVTDGTNFYIYYMSVRHWGDPGKWDCNNASIAVSTDGETFTKVSNVTWAGGSPENMFGLVQNTTAGGLPAEDLYFLATPSGRFGNAYCVTVAKSQILNQSAYRYYLGTDLAGNLLWGRDPWSVQAVIPGPIGELSAMWDGYLQKFVVMYLESNLGMIVLRTADRPWGPWSAPIGIVDSTEYPGLYGGFLHPDLVDNGGQEVYFIMSIWGKYNTFVLRADLISLKGNLIQSQIIFQYSPFLLVNWNSANFKWFKSKVWNKERKLSETIA